MKKRDLIFTLDILIIISILSIITSSYLIYIHYADSSSRFCDISPSLSCDIVNKSRYSEFPPGNGIPVSIIGILTFTLILIMLILIKKNKKFTILNYKVKNKDLMSLTFYILIISILFSLYLIYTELFLILSICLLCVALDILIIAMLVLVYKIRVKFK